MILLFLLFILVINVGLAYLAMKYLRMYTKNTKYSAVLDASVFLISLVILMAITLFILINTVTIGR